METPKSASAAPGIALIVVGVAAIAATALEAGVGEARGDGDNPADSLDYLATYGDLYALSGLAFVALGAALVVAVVGVNRQLARPSVAFSASSAFGILAGGFFAVGGVMRLQANGTVPHIRSLDQQWGESAYLAVQMAGTQGLISTGIMAFAAWLIALAVVFARKGVRGPLVFAFFPAIVLLILLADLAIPGLDELPTEWLFLVYVGAITIGLPLCAVAFGIALLTRRVRTRLAAER